MTLEQDRILNDRYRIIDVLGQGGMAAVYRAVDENLGVEVAVKENLFTTEEYARQFRREATILASLRHSNLPRVTDHFVIPDQGQYLVMDYIEGEDLRQRMSRLGPLPEEQVILLGVALCDALMYMHFRKPPVFHRDIKPGNVKITPKGDIYLVDFGLAKISIGSQTTTTGARAMTPGYSPPEQYGTGRTDGRTDIYSLGATLYAALTGAIPEDGLARAMEQATLTPVRARRGNVARRLAEAIEKSLEVLPDDRFQTAEEMRAALLKASTATRRLVESGEITLPPPPENLGEDGGAQQPPQDDFTLEIPSSEPVPAAVSSKKTKKRRSGCLGMLLLAIFVLAGGIGLLSVFANRAQLPVWTSGLLGVPTATASPIITASPLPTQTATKLPTATSQPTPSSTVTLMPTNTWTPTVTPSPTITLTPTVTPQGGGYGEIAYASSQYGHVPQIWVMLADGSNSRQITDQPGGACQPDWSPDGAQLVFISPCEKAQRPNIESYPGASLYLVQADGSGITQLTESGAGDYDPAWSPDGKWIAFTSLRDGLPQIYLISPDDGRLVRLSQPENVDFQPAWSPNGGQIAFISARKNVYQVWVMPASGEPQALFSRSGEAKNLQPIWTRNGLSIVFSQTQPGSIPVLRSAVYQQGGLQEDAVTDAVIGLPMINPAFSPDGYWLAVETWQETGNHDIYILSADGKRFIQLTIETGMEFGPVWRPIFP